MFSNKERLKKIEKSLKIGDVVNSCNGYLQKWLIITDIKPIDEPIPNRQNVKLIIRTRSIDRDDCNTDNIFFISDIKQFAIIQDDG